MCTGIEEGLLIAALAAGAATVATTVVEHASRPNVAVPNPGKDPFPDGIPTPDEAAMRARLAHNRDLSSLRIDAAAGAGVQTGIQIPN